MRRIAWTGLAVTMLIAACGDDTATTTQASTIPSTTTTSAPAVRVIGVLSQPGRTLSEGDSLSTGTDESAVLSTDDGITIVVLEESEIAIAVLTWDDGRPATTLSLTSGSVVAMRDDAPAGFAIETPGFSAGFKGSAIGVVYRDEGERADVSCLYGDCYATAEGTTTALTGDEWLDLSDGVATKAAFTAEQRRLWARALEAIRAAGGSVDACACDERALLCEGAIEVPYFPSCPDDTTCECEGPDLLCEDERVFENDQQCMANITALTELIVPDFTATYDCIDARGRYNVFDTRPDAEVILRPYDDEASSCANLMPSYPVTYTIPGPNAAGSLAGATSYASGSSFDFEIIDVPGEGQQGVIGPRYGGNFTYWGDSFSGETSNSEFGGETTDTVMTRSGTETISILGQSVPAVLYEGSFTGEAWWRTNDGRVSASVSYAGTIKVWFHAVTGIELRTIEEAFYTGCSNCSGFSGLRERLEIVEIVSTNQPLGAGS